MSNQFVFKLAKCQILNFCLQVGGLAVVPSDMLLPTKPAARTTKMYPRHVIAVDVICGRPWNTKDTATLGSRTCSKRTLRGSLRMREVDERANVSRIFLAGSPGRAYIGAASLSSTSFEKRGYLLAVIL